MDVSLRRALTVGRAVVHEARANNVRFMAGSVAYSAFLSLLPLLLLLLLVTSAVGGDVLSRQVRALTRAYLSPTEQGLFDDALANAAERAGASLVGVVSLVWGMFRIFRGIETAFAELYGTTGEATLVDAVRDGLVVFASLGLATVGSGVTAAIASWFSETPLYALVDAAALVAGLVVALFPMYYVFPDENVSASEALPGAVFAAVGWAALEAVFSAYVALVDTVAVYGTLGAVILLLVWLYGSSLVLLVGVCFNVVLARRSDSYEQEGERAAST